MTNPGKMDERGVTTVAPKEIEFEVPANKGGGSRHDMGSLVLFLVANWFVNGETVLIDGGVSVHPRFILMCYILLMWVGRLCSGIHLLTELDAQKSKRSMYT
jgi:hypothetical protein